MTVSISGVLGGKRMKQNEMTHCNGCAKELKIENEILKEDIFEGRKAWGYFSKKDLTVDTFCLCEECYEAMIQNFKIPVDRREKVEAI